RGGNRRLRGGPAGAGTARSALARVPGNACCAALVRTPWSESLGSGAGDNPNVRERFFRRAGWAGASVPECERTCGDPFRLSLNTFGLSLNAFRRRSGTVQAGFRRLASCRAVTLVPARLLPIGSTMIFGRLAGIG